MEDKMIKLQTKIMEMLKEEKLSYAEAKTLLHNLRREIAASAKVSD